MSKKGITAINKSFLFYIPLFSSFISLSFIPFFPFSFPSLPHPCSPFPPPSSASLRPFLFLPSAFSLLFCIDIYHSRFSLFSQRRKERERERDPVWKGSKRNKGNNERWNNKGNSQTSGEERREERPRHTNTSLWNTSSLQRWRTSNFWTSSILVVPLLEHST